MSVGYHLLDVDKLQTTASQVLHQKHFYLSLQLTGCLMISGGFSVQQHLHVPTAMLEHIRIIDLKHQHLQHVHSVQQEHIIKSKQPVHASVVHVVHMHNYQVHQLV